jgi:MoaA/NifB/PqqE/SkfB family radical SAM enzyme
MPNILLTTRCNLSCEYCFAQERMLQKRSQDMAMQDVEKVIAFLKRSGSPVFRAMGGEPTLHPHFGDILRLALGEDMRVDLLSNATWREEFNALHARISPSRLLFLLNIDHPDRYSPKLWARIECNLAALSGRKGVTLSFNIFEKHPRSDYIFDLAARYDIRSVRMSFSLPVLGARNAHLRLEDYRGATPFIMGFVRRAQASGISVKLDNAVPPCIFTHEQAGELLLGAVLDLGRNSRCEPIVDIGPDLTVWCCFCLSKLWNRNLDEFDTLEEIEGYYRQVLSPYQDRIFPMDECAECPYRELWGCQGGCITFSIVNGRGTQSLEWQAEDESGWDPEAVLALSNGVAIRRYDIPKESYVLCRAASSIEVEADGSFGPLWPLLDGTHSVQDIVSRFLSAGDRGRHQSPLGTFVQEVAKEGLQDLLHGLLRQGFLVQRPV